MAPDRPALSDKEIEITPEMIEAGVSEFCAYDSRFDSEAEAVSRIYSAMKTAKGEGKSAPVAPRPCPS